MENRRICFELPLEPHALELRDFLVAFESFARLRGISILGFTNASFQSFLALPRERQLELGQQIQDLLSLNQMSSLRAEEAIDILEELNDLDMVMLRLNVYSDHGLAEFVKPGQIVEIYNLKGQQIFRNLEFCRHCGYDIITLSLFPWFELYERPKLVTESILKHMDKVLKKERPEAFEFPRHTMRQLKVKRNQFYMISPGFAVPLKDVETSKITAILTTLESTPIPNTQVQGEILHL